MHDLALVFTIGLLGSAHCVGMCGGFVLTLGHFHAQPGRLQLHQALYFLGKTTTYAFFGAVAGGLGAAMGAALGGMQNVLAIMLGLVLVMLGLSLCGVLHRFEGFRRLAGARWISVALGRLMSRQSGASTFGLGLLNGVLPCGLVYAMLAKAATTGSIGGGALTLAVFGLATIPALYALSLAGFLMRPVWRARLNLVGGILVVLMGALTIVRGTPAATLLHSGHGPDASEHVEHHPPMHPGAHTAHP